jgi:hypothetical protein
VMLSRGNLHLQGLLRHNSSLSSSLSAALSSSLRAAVALPSYNDVGSTTVSADPNGVESRRYASTASNLSSGLFKRRRTVSSGFRHRYDQIFTRFVVL